MSIFLIRHGTTDASKNVYAGRRDVPLNEVGRKQAADLVRVVGCGSIGVVLSSPLSRAVQTAESLAAAHHVAVTVCEGLQEIDFGIYEGKAKADIRLKLRRDHRFEAIAGGESLYQVWLRLLPVAPQILLPSQNGSGVAVVAHYWSARLLRGMLAGWSFDQSCAATDFRPQLGQSVQLPAIGWNPSSSIR